MPQKESKLTSIVTARKPRPTSIKLTYQSLVWSNFNCLASLESRQKARYKKAKKALTDNSYAGLTNSEKFLFFSQNMELSVRFESKNAASTIFKTLGLE